jgi:hypothetical protein
MKLPEEALCQIRTILDNYQRMRLDSGPHPGEDSEVDRLRGELEHSPQDLWWTDIAQAELCTLQLLSKDDLHARLGGWRRRLREVAGEARYNDYLSSASNVETASADDIRADLSECMRSVFYFYGAYGLSARSRASVTSWLFRVSLLVIVAQALIGFLISLIKLPNITEIAEYALATSFFAVLGGMVSVQRRLQDPNLTVDPFYQYIQTSADWFGIAFVSPIFSAVFGLLMYGLLQSNLIGTRLVQFTAGGIPKSTGDTAVLFILGFAAGFAEQLIPDAISRIAARALGGISNAAPAAPSPSPALVQSRNTNGQVAQPSSNGAAVAAAPAASTSKLNASAPLQATPEAAQLGHDPMLASDSSEFEREKGIVQYAHAD